MNVNIVDYWNYFVEFLNSAYSHLENLVATLNNVAFDENNVIFQFFGLMRYIVGDSIYFLVFSAVLIAISLLIFVLLKNVWNFVFSLGRHA